MTSVLKIRSTIFGAIHEYFRKEGFYEFQSPLMLNAAGETGSSVFKVDYFGKEMFLAQTWQLHAETAIFALEKIYTIAPSFRAEKSNTTRHLCEYWHAEMEAALLDIVGDRQSCLLLINKYSSVTTEPVLITNENDVISTNVGEGILWI